MTDRRWCVECQAEREGLHIHGDPLESLTSEQLLERCREQALYIQLEDVGNTRFEAMLAKIGRRK